MAPDVKDGARAVFDAYYPLLTFLSDHPGELTEELDAKFASLRRTFNQARGAFMYDAGEAVGTTTSQ